jgi:membrane protein involved in colicin uptake
MKTIATLLVTAAALTAPVLSFAQSADHGLTRAQVRAELVQLERAGYNPQTAADASYPQEIQLAEAKVAAENNAATTTSAASAANTAQTDDAVGGMPGYGSSESGKPMKHSRAMNACVGPVSFCNIYFGS